MHTKCTLCIYRFVNFTAVSSYIDTTKSRIKTLLEPKREMTEDDMEKFGKKDPDAYPFCYQFLSVGFYNLVLYP